ncbi:TonB-dependent receptor [Ignavibacteriales bacterium]
MLKFDCKTIQFNKQVALLTAKISIKQLVFICMILQTILLSQSTGTLRGFVTDSTNGNSVISANIVVVGAGKGASSDLQGYYFIPGVNTGKQIIKISNIGYLTREVEVRIIKNTIIQLNIALVPSSLTLEEVSITGTRRPELNDPSISIEQIPLQQIKSVPAGVEADMLRALKVSPGVTSTGDITARYYVRGGGSDQNAVVINGSVLYNPFHALGLFSVIDPEMIKMLEFYKGGFTSEYGGRLSSILNVITRDGNKNKFTGTAAASTMSGKMSFEGPIPGGSFLFTGRKSYRPEAVQKFLNNRSAPFEFYDLSFKLNYSNPEFYENGWFTLHGFFSDDKIENKNLSKEDYYFNNSSFGLNWYQVWASPLYSNMSFIYTTFEGEVVPNLTTSKPRKNIIADFTSNWDFTYIFDSRDELWAGFHNKILTTELKLTNLFGSKTELRQRGLDMVAYIKYKLLRFETFRMDAGMRLNVVSASEKSPFFLEPRLNITYTPLPILAFRLGVGRFSQNLVTLSNEEELISIFEPWVVVPDYIKPAQATHIIGGIDYYLTEWLKLSIEGYYKDIDNLVDINELKYTNLDPDFVQADGRSYGLDFSFDLSLQTFFFKGSYSLGYSFKKKNGIEFSPRYDTRHTVNLQIGWIFLEGWQFNAVWRFSSGLPFTGIAGFYDKWNILDPWSSYYAQGAYDPSFLYGARNAQRLPSYHRLDLSISKSFKLFFTKIDLDVSLLNVYDRRNIFYFIRDTGERVDMLPFLPSASIRIEI